MVGIMLLGTRRKDIEYVMQLRCYVVISIIYVYERIRRMDTLYEPLSLPVLVSYIYIMCITCYMNIT